MVCFAEGALFWRCAEEGFRQAAVETYLHLHETCPQTLVDMK
jgi:hypothetical protein